MRATIGHSGIHIDLADKDITAMTEILGNIYNIRWIFIYNIINAKGSSQVTDNYLDGIQR